MSGNSLTVRSRNFIIFRKAEAYKENGADDNVVVTGFRVPPFPGKYKILVEHVGYGNPAIPKDIDARLRKVRDELKDPYELPQKISVESF